MCFFMSTRTEIDPNGNFFCHARHIVMWSASPHLLILKQVEESAFTPSHHVLTGPAHTLVKKKKTYLFVLILQADLVLTGPLSLGPLHFVSTTRGCSILQAQHLSAAMEIRTESSQSSLLTFKSLPLLQWQVICEVWRGSPGMVAQGKDDWVYASSPIWEICGSTAGCRSETRMTILSFF